MPFVQNSEDEGYASKLEEILQKNNISYSKVSRLEKTSYLIKLSDDKEIIISSQKDINKQISSLQFILSHFTMEGKEFSKLDLRFDKPVIILK
jgi:hypothetical protein